MKTIRLLPLLAATFSALAAPVKKPAAPGLEERFHKVPQEDRLAVLWFWSNAIDKPAITHDLEAMAHAGIEPRRPFRPRLLSHSANREEGGLVFLSPRFLELFRFALDEATRLGIKITALPSNGWYQGGPWVTPDMGEQMLVWSETSLQGPADLLNRDFLFPPTRACLPDWPGMAGVRGEEGAESIRFAKISSISANSVKKFRQAERDPGPIPRALTGRFSVGGVTGTYFLRPQLAIEHHFRLPTASMRRELFALHLPNPERVKANLRTLADQSRGLQRRGHPQRVPERHPRRQPRSRSGEVGGDGGDAGAGGPEGQGGEGEAWREGGM